MAFKVFISHSASPRELAIVYALAEEAAKRGMVPVVPDRAWEPQQGVPQRILQSINECQVIVVLGTRYGQHGEWLYKETLEGLRKNKQALFILDPEVAYSWPGVVMRVDINRANPRLTIIQAAQHLESMKLAKDQNDALTWLVIGGLLFILLSEKKE